MKCLKCNKVIGDGDVYCGYCGIHQEKWKHYLEKVSNKIHKERDKEYDKSVKTARRDLQTLQNEREKEIERIANSRWESIGKDFSYNITEGKISINNENYLFSDIKGAEITSEDSSRIVVNSTSTSQGKSRKHASLGGAVAGGLVAGPVGVLVGGAALGKTKSKGKTNTITNQSEIPTCYHIGVNIDINGFNTEVVLLSQTVDKTSNAYTETMKLAQSIVDKLRVLSKTPVPKKFLKPEEEQSVLDLDKKIEDAAKRLENTINDKPTYEIPESYLK